MIAKNNIPQVIVELPAYISEIDNLWDESTQIEFKNYIGNHPLAGDIIQGAGGIRKIRWRANGKGKRGGVRVIYYFYDEFNPIFLLYAYSKNMKENLTEKEKKILQTLVKQLKNSMRWDSNGK